MPTYHITTYGCQMNEHDSEILAGQLRAIGYTPAPAADEADFILLNTCAIRETAEEKVFGEIGRLKGLKDRRPDLLIGVSGCMAQVEENVERLRRQAPHVDLIFGTHNLHRLPELLAQAREEEGMVVDVWKSAGEVVEHLPADRAPGLSAWVTIIYGCDKYCTYCIVPKTRGRERSRAPEDVIGEVRSLVEAGYREVTLLGQNVNSYGKDLGSGYDFADLLTDLDRIPGLRRIRYMTSHPRDFTPRLIDVIARSERVCEHYHLPVQAGSNEILRRMNRKYTREEYLGLVERIREADPEAVITTDIIVGFPGETEEDFRQTLDLVERVRFDSAYTFVYSPRAGTPAARWQDPVSNQEKKGRLQRLMALQNRISLERNQELVGRACEVLIEGPSKKDPRVYTARTRGNKLVLLRGAEGMEHRFARVEIVKAQTWTLEGRLLEVEPPLPVPGRAHAAIAGGGVRVGA